MSTECYATCVLKPNSEIFLPVGCVKLSIQHVYVRKFGQLADSFNKNN